LQKNQSSSESLVHSVGASFNLKDRTPTPTIRDHTTNLTFLQNSLATNSPFATELESTLEKIQLENENDPFAGRVGFRCVSPDYMPLAGPVVERQTFDNAFSALKKNAKRHLTNICPPIPGLFVSTAYGSHGFTAAPLAAEILAAQIDGQPIPCSENIRRSLSPSRFLVRQLIRAQ
jgi:tRNA 5-methylaminomethyl-2-thiouridine biosynthesis bifunctional protein